MADFPSMPLFTDAYMADTDHLTDAEQGLYMRILMTMWRSPEKRLPNDDIWLARRFRKTVEEVQKLVRPLVQEFCQNDGNWITQKRLLKEWEYVKKYSLQQSERAKSRWDKEKRLSQGNAERHSSGNAPTPTPTPIVKKEREAKASPKKSAFGSLVLSAEMEAHATEKGCLNVRELFDAFRDHHTAKGSVFSDWPAAWRTWVRNDRKYAPQNRSGFNGQRSGPAGGNSISRATLAVIEANRELELRANGVHRHEDVNGNGARRGPVGGEGANTAGGQGNGGAGDWTLPILDQEPGQGGH